MPAAMDTIGKFEVIKEIGKGATSAVYQAYDPFQNRQVAIKVVFPEALVDAEHGRRYRKLFITEASLAGKLSHPHIVAIYDAVAATTSPTSSWNTWRARPSSSTRATTTCCRSRASWKSATSARAPWTMPPSRASYTATSSPPTS
jgi:serine/threonine protein kinase